MDFIGHSDLHLSKSHINKVTNTLRMGNTDIKTHPHRAAKSEPYSKGKSNGFVF